MKLTNGIQVNLMENIRSNIDRRVFIDYYVMEYIGEDKEIYRKAFEVKPGIKPTLPTSGTHKTLNDMKKQW